MRYHINSRVQYCDSDCDYEEHYDSYEDAYRALRRKLGKEFSLKPTNVDQDVRAKLDEFWKGQFTDFGDEYDYAEVSMGSYEYTVYRFLFDGKNVDFEKTPYIGNAKVLQSWSYDEFLDLSTQIEFKDDMQYLEELVEDLLAAYGYEFEHIEFMI